MNGIEHVRSRGCRGRQLNRARQIHAVSVVDTPEVQHDAVPRPSTPPSRTGVRQRAVRSGCDDRLERRTLESGSSYCAVDVRRHVPLGTARQSTQCQDLPSDVRQHPRRSAQRRDLGVVLDQTAPARPPFNRGQSRRHGSVAAPASASAVCQPVEAAQRHRALDAERRTGRHRRRSRGNAFRDSRSASSTATSLSSAHRATRARRARRSGRRR